MANANDYIIVFGMWDAEQVDSVYQIGGIDEIKRWITFLQKVDHEYQLAIFYAQMGEYNIAPDLLEQAAEGFLFCFLVITS